MRTCSSCQHQWIGTTPTCPSCGSWNEGAKYTPSLQEIHEETALIRKRWSEREHRRRAGLSSNLWEAPQVELLGIEHLDRRHPPSD